MKTPLIIWIVLIVIIIVWIAGSLYAIQSLEEPQYSVIEKNSEYEIRQYDSYIVAEVEVSGSQNEALNNGFRLLAWYIFGGNTWSNSIAMTAPVSEIKTESTQIAMTVPVSETVNGDKRIVQFSMPSTYTLATLPQPNDDKVQLKTIDWYTAAVLNYTWYATEKQVEQKKAELQALLTQNNREILWEMISAQYNPPLSFPFVRRNEIIAKIAPIKK